MKKSYAFSLWTRLLFLGRSLQTERIQKGALEFHSWKRHLSKHTLIKIALPLFLHQFTESKSNFLLLETQFLTDGEKGVGTWRKYHNEVTWQPCGERLHAKGRRLQENENKIYRRSLHCESNTRWKVLLCDSVRDLARETWLPSWRKEKGPQAKILGWGGTLRCKGNFAIGYQVNSCTRSINKLSQVVSLFSLVKIWFHCMWRKTSNSSDFHI